MKTTTAAAMMTAAVATGFLVALAFGTEWGALVMVCLASFAAGEIVANALCGVADAIADRAARK